MFSQAVRSEIHQACVAAHLLGFFFWLLLETTSANMHSCRHTKTWSWKTPCKNYCTFLLSILYFIKFWAPSRPFRSPHSWLHPQKPQKLQRLVSRTASIQKVPEHRTSGWLRLVFRNKMKWTSATSAWALRNEATWFLSVGNFASPAHESM